MIPDKRRALWYNDPPMRRIYLDYASTTPVDPRVLREMKPYFTDQFYNPSALYKEGVEVKKIIESARNSIAKILNGQPRDIIFTGSGTESVNLAITGLVYAYRRENPGKTPHIITSVIEHSAVLEVCRMLEMEAYAKVTYLPVHEDGCVKPSDVENALTENTVLVSIMYANNEIGSVQLVKEIARRVKLWKLDKKRELNNYPFVHTDASQAVNYCSIDREKLGLDMVTIDGQKIYGPKGVGILYAKSYIPLVGIMLGGGQEKGLRPGTENVPAIVGIAKALDIAIKVQEKESARLKILRDSFFFELLKVLPEAIINGGIENRLPNNINFCVPGVDAEFLVLELDAQGIACAFVSACENLNDISESYVIGALPQAKECARSSIRLSLGRETSYSDLKRVLKILPALCKLARF